MEKASFLTRLRFSYTYALLAIVVGELRDRSLWRRTTPAAKVNAAKVNAAKVNAA